MSDITRRRPRCKGGPLSTEGFKAMLRRLRLSDLKKLFAYGRIHGGRMPDEFSPDAIKRFAAEHDPQTYSPEELGKMLQVTGMEYVCAGPFKQVAPIDMDKAARADNSRIRANGRRRMKRKAAGIKPQSESLESTKPWLAMGINRSTWKRRRAKGQITNKGEPSLAEINLSENARLGSPRMAVERTTTHVVREDVKQEVSLSVRTATDPENETLSPH